MMNRQATAPPHAFLTAVGLVALGVGAAALLARPEPGEGIAGHGTSGSRPARENHMGEDTHMEQMPRMISAAEAGVRVELTAPATIQPDAPVRLTYRLTEAGSAAPIVDVVVSHEQPMHLIAVRRDMAQFQHVHPRPTGRPGEFEIELSFPTAGSYVLYDEFTRASGQDIVQRDELTVGGRSDPAALVEDLAPKTVGNVRVSLQDEGSLTSSEETRLTFRLADAATGQALTTLKPYLGAAAHVVILTEDAGTFAHTHGESVGADGHHGQATEGDGGHGGPSARIGSEIAFHHSFPARGLYKVWGQFQDANGQIITADFVVRVD
jgi:Cu+-exporting ATPase